MTPDQLTLQERVRRFNFGTPTAMHVCTHELVNDLWQTHVDMLAALQLQASLWRDDPPVRDCDLRAASNAISAAIRKATGA